MASEHVVPIRLHPARDRASERNVARLRSVPAYLANLRDAWDRSDHVTGAAWYDEARGAMYDLAHRYHRSLKRVAYATAVLSNNTAWPENLALVEHVLWAVGNGLTPRGHYRALIDKAVRIVRDGEFKALRGPKVVPFARALMGDTSAVVVDRWVLRAAGAYPSGWNAYLADMRRVEVALRMLAREVHGKPARVQAIIWHWAKETLG